MTDENPFVGGPPMLRKAAETYPLTEVEHRDMAIDAIYRLIDEKVLPWVQDNTQSVDHIPDPADSDEVDDRIAGHVLRDAFPELEFESENQLRDVLELVDLQGNSESERRRFFRHWAAHAAEVMVVGLLNRLKRNDVGEQRAHDEAERLMPIVEMNLPLALRRDGAWAIRHLAPEVAVEQVDEFEEEVIKDEFRRAA